MRITKSTNKVVDEPIGGEIILVYEDDPDWIRKKGQELWNAGYNVKVEVEGEFYSYLDYIITTRVHPNEPIEAVVRWYIAQKEAGRRYRTALQRMTRHIAKETGQTLGQVRTRFKRIRINGGERNGGLQGV